MGDTLFTTHSMKRRTARACDTCRKKRTKCSGDFPCSGCRAFGFTCGYTDTNRKRGPAKKNKDNENVTKLNTKSKAKSKTSISESSISPIDSNHQRNSAGSGHTENSSNNDHYDVNCTFNSDSRKYSSVSHSTFSNDHESSELNTEFPYCDESICDNIPYDSLNKCTVFVDADGLPFFISGPSATNAAFRFLSDFNDGLLPVPFKVNHTLEGEYIATDTFPDNASVELISEVVECYIRNVHPFLPLFNQNHLRAEVSRGVFSTKFKWLLKGIAIATASHVIDYKNCNSANYSSSDSHEKVRMFPMFNMTREELDTIFNHVRDYINDVTLATELSLILCLLFIFSCVKKPGDHINRYRYIGIAVTMCFELGYNRELSLNQLQIKTESVLTKEIRSRLFYCTLLVERLSSFFLSKPTLIADEVFDVSFSQAMDSSAEEKMDIEYLKHMPTLLRIMGSIVNYYNNPKSWLKAHLTEMSFFKLTLKDLDLWHSILPKEFHESRINGCDRPFMFTLFYKFSHLLLRILVLRRMDSTLMKLSGEMIELLEIGSKHICDSPIFSFMQVNFCLPICNILTIVTCSLIQPARQGNQKSLEYIHRTSMVMLKMIKISPFPTLNIFHLHNTLTKYGIKSDFAEHTRSIFTNTIGFFKNKNPDGFRSTRTNIHSTKYGQGTYMGSAALDDIPPNDIQNTMVPPLRHSSEFLSENSRLMNNNCNNNSNTIDHSNANNSSNSNNMIYHPIDLSSGNRNPELRSSESLNGNDKVSPVSGRDEGYMLPNDFLQPYLFNDLLDINWLF